MNQTTAIPMVCQYCGRPCESGTWIGSNGPYHPECTRGPDYKPETFQPPKAEIPWPEVGKQAQREGFAVGVLMAVLHWDVPAELKEKIKGALAHIESLK